MAKKIKFNLICDNTPIRTIEDLQNNFSIEDVLAYYENGLLYRWLAVHEYTDELEKVLAIEDKSSVDIIKKLIRIFQITCDEREIEESVYIFDYLKEKNNLHDLYEKRNSRVEDIINDYRVGYQQIVWDILENPNDMARIKANIQKIVKDYKWIFELHYRELFYLLRGKSELALMCLLMNEESRNYYFPISTIYKDEASSGEKTIDFNDDMVREVNEKKSMFNQVCYNIIESQDVLAKLGKNLKSFSGVTDGYWKDLEPKGKKYMIISIGRGDYVRSAGVLNGDLGYSDILYKFVILDGIDYKSNSADRKLLYMEV